MDVVGGATQLNVLPLEIMIFDQAEFNIRCEWGLAGVKALAPISDIVIIVDVMSFSTCVSIAIANGAQVLPLSDRGEAATVYAKSRDAELAGPRGRSKYSLSPSTFMGIPRGTRVILPSPNGALLSMTTGTATTFTGCFRNARSVAAAASKTGKTIAVICAGEKWKDDGSLRPAIEDFLGAGAIIANFKGNLSPEAELAVKAFSSTSSDLQTCLEACSSGKELIKMGYRSDIPLIADMNSDNSVPILINGVYTEVEHLAGADCG